VTRVVFMGSPAFAVPSLQALVAAGYEVAAVVTQPDRPAGRGGRLTRPEVKVAALELGIPVLQPETMRDPATVEALAAIRPELFVVAAYGKILPRAVLALPLKGSVNVHASLLPRWRGASPIAAAILAGDAETGICIMEMAPKMDAGPVIACAHTEIGPAESAGELEGRLAALGAEKLVETLPGWLDGRLQAVAQDETAATYCSLVTKTDGYLRASTTAVEAARAVRAYSPWPGASVEYRGERLAIWRANVAEDASGVAPGCLVRVGRNPAIAMQGGLLVLEEVQRSGGKRVTGEQFVNGERGNLAAQAGLA
jgi:methionyl-tRNA formyltransferase